MDQSMVSSSDSLSHSWTSLRGRAQRRGLDKAHHAARQHIRRLLAEITRGLPHIGTERPACTLIDCGVGIDIARERFAQRVVAIFCERRLIGLRAPVKGFADAAHLS